VSTTPAAVFATSAVLVKLLVPVEVEVDVDVDVDIVPAAVFVDELPELPPPPHAASVSALALAAINAHLDRDLPMLKLSSSQGAPRFPAPSVPGAGGGVQRERRNRRARRSG
jgi:hypothetical protein